MIKIKKLTPPLPYDKLSAVLRDAFQERVEAGLNFACATFTGEDLKNHLSDNSVIFGVYQDDSLIAMNVLNSIRTKFGFTFGTEEYVAVISKAKRKGIGYALFKECIKEAQNLGLDFILSDTAVYANSAILNHKKVGFKVYGYSHYPGRVYESVNFIYPLTYKGRLLASRLGRKILSILFCNK